MFCLNGCRYDLLIMSVYTLFLVIDQGTHRWLTHLCRMYFPIIINWTSPFTILGLVGDIFHFYSYFKRNFCKQTVENLIRRRGLRRLNWFCTVCLCPTKRTLDLYGLKSAISCCKADGRQAYSLCTSRARIFKTTPLNSMLSK